MELLSTFRIRLETIKFHWSRYKGKVIKESSCHVDVQGNEDESLPLLTVISPISGIHHAGGRSAGLGENFGGHCIGDVVGTRASQSPVEKTYICRYRESNPNPASASL